MTFIVARLSAIALSALVCALITLAADGAEAEETVGASPALKTAAPVAVGTFEPNRLLLSTGGDKGGDLVLSPEVGLSHTVREREQSGGVDTVTHKVHAQAGGRVSLYDRFYLGFATKLPIYDYGAAKGASAAVTPQQQIQSQHKYEMLRLSPENLTVTGEVGYRIGKRLHLNIYYDQNRYSDPTTTRRGIDENVFGTSMIYRFE